MKAIKFDLSGGTAFFKKPDVNSYVYFTYGHIHKVALLGILGSILGLDGYALQREKIYPDFYNELKDIKVSIVPNNEEGYITKKVQTFNNSVGYASEEQGGNLIVKEQWLENPSWTIYILLDDSDNIAEIEKRLYESKYTYIPYLGKNDHFATIQNFEKVKLESVIGVGFIDSLFIDGYFEINNEDIPDIFSNDLIVENKWKYQERLPISLEETTNKYEYKAFLLTNMNLSQSKDCELYKHDNKNLFFF